MPTVSSESTLELLREAAIPIAGKSADFVSLLDQVGNAHFVLLGEASHGTHEFYHARAEITKRLIEEKNFSAVAAEADWPDAYRVNRFVRGDSADSDADHALCDFKRFPAWMWRNADVLAFVEWLRSHNDSLPQAGRRVGFYGLDLYSLNTSMEGVLRYLEKTDPAAAERARYRYGCFEDYGENTQAYGYAASIDIDESCERQVIEQLLDLRRNAAKLTRRDGSVAEDEFFFAEQNARVVRNAEEYYRSMFQGHIESWNLRDQHMVETLEALETHLRRRIPEPKIVVWAHNSHLGDARATQMSARGKWNVGQLVRERHEHDVVLIGFTTFTGTVTAASNWDGPVERKRVRPALRDSYEHLFHDAALRDFHVMLQEHAPLSDELRRPRLERAIGVIYKPESERISHYFESSLPRQFDAVIHFDNTSAVRPLEPTKEWHATYEASETFPTGM